MVDGDESTRWSSAFSDPQWSIVDLGQIRRLTGVSLFWKTAAPAKAYGVAISDGGTTWRNVYATADEPAMRRSVVVTGTWRDIRVTATERRTGYSDSLCELSAYVYES